MTNLDSILGENNGTPLQYFCLENPMDRGAWKAAVHGVAEGWTRLSNFTYFSLSCIGEGNGNPLQCSCLENPRDGIAWWAAAYGVTQSRSRLKWLSSSSSRQHIKKQRHYFANTGPSSQTMIFPVVMYGCESWTVKKVEHWRIDAFNCGVGEDCLESLQSNQSILKEISSGCPVEGMMLKLKLQYLATWCEHLTYWKRPWCWERLRAAGEVDDRGWNGWMASSTQWT